MGPSRQLQERGEGGAGPAGQKREGEVFSFFFFFFSFPSRHFQIHLNMFEIFLIFGQITHHNKMNFSA